MNKLFLEILNSQHKDWVMFLIPFLLKPFISIFKFVKRKSDKRTSEKKLFWVGLMGGIDKKI